ncbi:hypothetical protein PG984_001371 [Apiospora sp. TS-2023a]
MNVRISEDWLDHLGIDSIRLADGSGVLAQLGLYHELHLKHWIYYPYYFGNESNVDQEEEEAHVAPIWPPQGDSILIRPLVILEHCLEWLRVAALCRGDTTLSTFRWGGKEGVSLETEYPVPHQCVNSASLMEWAEKRAVDITQGGVLQGPHE